MIKATLKIFFASAFILILTVSVYAEPIASGTVGPVQNPENGHYYEVVYVNPEMTWNEANAAASASIYNGMRGYLATITSASEEAFLLSTFGIIGGPHIWFGGFQSTNSASMSSGWHWITYEAWSYTHWDSTEPNDDSPPENNQENCLEYTDGVPAWNDESCDSGRNYYIVEFEPSNTSGVLITRCPPGSCGLSYCMTFIPIPGWTGCLEIGLNLVCGCTPPCPPSSCVLYIPTF